jgi:hypothetical protein
MGATGIKFAGWRCVTERHRPPAALHSQQHTMMRAPTHQPRPAAGGLPSRKGLAGGLGVLHPAARRSQPPRGLRVVAAARCAQGWGAWARGGLGKGRYVPEAAHVRCRSRPLRRPPSRPHTPPCASAPPCGAWTRLPRPGKPRRAATAGRRRPCGRHRATFAPSPPRPFAGTPSPTPSPSWTSRWPSWTARWPRWSARRVAGGPRGPPARTPLPRWRHLRLLVKRPPPRPLDSA